MNEIEKLKLDALQLREQFPGNDLVNRIVSRVDKIGRMFDAPQQPDDRPRRKPDRPNPDGRVMKDGAKDGKPDNGNGS